MCFFWPSCCFVAKKKKYPSAPREMSAPEKVFSRYEVAVQGNKLLPHNVLYDALVQCGLNPSRTDVSSVAPIEVPCGYTLEEFRSLCEFFAPTAAAVEIVVELFMKFDTNGDGVLDKSELHEALCGANSSDPLDESEYAAFWQRIHPAKSNAVNVVEFTCGMCPSSAVQAVLQYVEDNHGKNATKAWRDNQKAAALKKHEEEQAQRKQQDEADAKKKKEEEEKKKREEEEANKKKEEQEKQQKEKEAQEKPKDAAAADPKPKEDAKPKDAAADPKPKEDAKPKDAAADPKPKEDAKPKDAAADPKPKEDAKPKDEPKSKDAPKDQQKKDDKPKEQQKKEEAKKGCC